MTIRSKILVLVCSAGGLGMVSGAAADQIGESKGPAINTRVGGVRSAGPAITSGARRGTLLDRPSPFLPSRPSVGQGPRPSIGNGTLPRPAGVPTSGSGSGGVIGRIPDGSVDRPCGVPNAPGGSSIGSGTSIDGSTTNDRFRLRFHIGSGVNCDPHPGHHHHRPVCYRWPLTWGWNNWWNDQPQIVYSGPWYGNDPFVTTGQSGAAAPTVPAAGAAAAPRTLTAIEQADVFWQDGDLAQAVSQFKVYLKSAPEDTDAMRYLAVLLIDQKRLDEGIAMMAMAYQRTPQLASRPMAAQDVPGGLSKMRSRITTLAAHANRIKTSSSWLTLAALVQSEGRGDVAKSLISKSKAAGLDQTISTEFDAVLSR